MKRLYITLAATLALFLPVNAAGIEAVTYSKLVATISRVRAPVVSNGCIVFTAPGKARYTGIAFEHESYGKTHSFQRIIRKDLNGDPQKDADGRPLDPVLFFIAQIPPDQGEIRYRMVIDGLWTTDPMNERTAYDYENGMMVSTIPVERYEVFQTSNVRKGEVRFTYDGNPGSSITLAGTFNNWDPFMYDMAEIAPGKYELVLPLPQGTWYYAYFEGTTQLPDTTNHDRVYTRDGRVASVVKVLQ